jgi:hypothetical protein
MGDVPQGDQEGGTVPASVQVLADELVLFLLGWDAERIDPRHQWCWQEHDYRKNLYAAILWKRASMMPSGQLSACKCHRFLLSAAFSRRC